MMKIDERFIKAWTMSDMMDPYGALNRVIKDLKL